MAAALCLALLNLQLEKTARERALHVSIAVLAFFGVVLAETRATFAAVAVVLPFILFARRVRGPLLSVLPLALPFLILVAIAIHQVEPQLVPDLVDRVTRTNAQDPNVAWRLKVDHASLQQFWSSPLYGVGFGKTATISVLLPTGSLGLMLSQEQTVGQGAHDAYLWMLAGGGLSVLIPYLLLLAVFFWDSWRRFRGATDLHERVLLAWCMAAVACFAIPEVSSPPWDATQLIGFWVILLLPGIVPRRELRATTPGRAPGGARARRPARR
jgi:O-antigen ligase